LIIAFLPFALGISKNLYLLYIIIFYVILNLAYSSYLKHIVILDIFIIASGFVIRLFAGSVMVDIRLSSWIIIITFLLALFLALAKRRNDVILSNSILVNSKTKVRKNIDGYNLEFINTSMAIMSAIVVISYILYTTSKEVMESMGNDNLYLTSVFVLLGIMRYLKITIVDEQSENPSKVILNDKPLQLTILCYLVSFATLVLVI
jgi:4-hydroxybenzoate polyprenyltransferase